MIRRLVMALLRGGLQCRERRMFGDPRSEYGNTVRCAMHRGHEGDVHTGWDGWATQVRWRT